MEPGVVAEVESHDVGGVGNEADEGRRLADLLVGARAELLDEAFGQELARRDPTW